MPVNITLTLLGSNRDESDTDDLLLVTLPDCRSVALADLSCPSSPKAAL